MEQKFNTLYLLPDNDLKPSGKFVQYSLGTWDVDDLSGFNDFFDLSLNIMSDILRDCVVVFPIEFKMTRPSRRRLFLWKTPPKFSPTILTDRVISAAENNEYDLFYSIKEYEKKSGWFKHYYKTLFVMSKDADIEVLDFLSGRNLVKNENWGFGLSPYGYKKTDATDKYIVDDYINDIINVNEYLECPNFAVNFFIEPYHNMLHIVLNPAIISTDALLTTLKLHAKTHNFNLEVKI